MDVSARRTLREALRTRYPWLDDPDWGPAAVEAGECDDCGAEARLAQVCGPGAAGFLGRRCVARLGAQAWCSGHAEDAAAAVAWMAQLPPEADVVARLWWVATGEVTPAPGLVESQVARLALD